MHIKSLYPVELIFNVEPEGPHVRLGEIWRCIKEVCDSLLTNQMALSFSINISTGYIFIAKPNQDLEFLRGKKRMFFSQDSFYFQGLFIYINERDILSPDCQHKHILENGAPPDRFDVLYRLLRIEFHGFNSRIDV